MRVLLVCACVTVPAGVAGCAATNAASVVAPAKASRPAVTSTAAGAILSIRQVSGGTVPPPWGAVLLTYASASDLADDSGKSQVAQPPVQEFIVRSDDGALLSVVQSNEAGLHVGDRVIILRGNQTRLVPPG